MQHIIITFGNQRRLIAKPPSYHILVELARAYFAIPPVAGLSLTYHPLIGRNYEGSIMDTEKKYQEVENLTYITISITGQPAAEDNDDDATVNGATANDEGEWDEDVSGDQTYAPSTSESDQYSDDGVSDTIGSPPKESPSGSGRVCSRAYKVESRNDAGKHDDLWGFEPHTLASVSGRKPGFARKPGGWRPEESPPVGDAVPRCTSDHGGGWLPHNDCCFGIDDSDDWGNGGNDGWGHNDNDGHSCVKSSKSTSDWNLAPPPSLQGSNDHSPQSNGWGHPSPTSRDFDFKKSRSPGWSFAQRGEVQQYGEFMPSPCPPPYRSNISRQHRETSRGKHGLGRTADKENKWGITANKDINNGWGGGSVFHSESPNHDRQSFTYSECALPKRGESKDKIVITVAGAHPRHSYNFSVRPNSELEKLAKGLIIVGEHDTEKFDLYLGRQLLSPHLTFADYGIRDGARLDVKFHNREGGGHGETHEPVPWY